MLPEIIESDTLNTQISLPDSTNDNLSPNDSSAVIYKDELQNPSDKKMQEYKDLIKQEEDLPDSLKKKLR